MKTKKMLNELREAIAYLGREITKNKIALNGLELKILIERKQLVKDKLKGYNIEILEDKKIIVCPNTSLNLEETKKVIKRVNNEFNAPFDFWKQYPSLCVPEWCEFFEWTFVREIVE